MKVDDGVVVVELPIDGERPGGDADDEHPADEGASEPVVDLTAIQGHFERSRRYRDQCDPDAIDTQLTVGSHRGLLSIKRGGILEQPAAEEERFVALNRDPGDSLGYNPTSPPHQSRAGHLLISLRTLRSPKIFEF